jgi:hypothetical protein
MGKSYLLTAEDRTVRGVLVQGMTEKDLKYTENHQGGVSLLESAERLSHIEHLAPDVRETSWLHTPSFSS